MDKRFVHPSLLTEWHNARRLDAADSLAVFREEFHTGSGIYLDGNSLGLLSRSAAAAVERVLKEWQELAIEAWLDASKPWFFLAESIGNKAAPLVGAKPGELVACGSTTTNLHSLVSTLFPQGRRVIVSDALNFSSDIYVLRDQLSLRGLDSQSHLRLVASRDGYVIDEEAILSALDDDVGLLVLSTVQYRSGQLFDIEAITRRAHAVGARVIWDASHSAGAVPHEFHRWGVDGAVFCGYKYLNGGPGSTGFLYIHERHARLKPALSGWFGHRKETQFQLKLDFEMAEGAGRFQMSTPHVLSLAPLDASLDLFALVNLQELRRKSLAMTELLMALGDRYLAPCGLKIVTPRQSLERGGHVAFASPAAYALAQALRHHGIVPDFRPPDILRLAPVAFYNTYSELVETVSCLLKIFEEVDLNRYQKPTDIP
jgi:kynureninase